MKQRRAEWVDQSRAKPPRTQETFGDGASRAGRQLDRCWCGAGATRPSLPGDLTQDGDVVVLTMSDDERSISSHTGVEAAPSYCLARQTIGAAPRRDSAARRPRSKSAAPAVRAGDLARGRRHSAPTTSSTMAAHRRRMPIEMSKARLALTHTSASAGLPHPWSTAMLSAKRLWPEWGRRRKSGRRFVFARQAPPSHLLISAVGELSAMSKETSVDKMKDDVCLPRI